MLKRWGFVLVLVFLVSLAGCNDKDKEYTLSISINPEETGYVSKDPDRPADKKGTEVTLTAVGDEGWVFDHWSSGLGGSQNPGYVYMDGDKWITAQITSS